MLVRHQVNISVLPDRYAGQQRVFTVFDRLARADLVLRAAASVAAAHPELQETDPFAVVSSSFLGPSGLGEPPPASLAAPPHA